MLLQMVKFHSLYGWVIFPYVYIWNIYTYIYTRAYIWATLVAQMVKNLPAMWQTRVWSLGQEDPLEKGMANHSSILAWKIPWTERGAWWATVHGVAKSLTRLSDFTFTFFPSPGESSQLRTEPRVFCTAGGLVTIWATRESLVIKWVSKVPSRH